MDRKIIYPGAIPLENDLLETNRFSMVGLAKLAEAIMGTSTFLHGLACQPTSPASMAVTVAAGEIYSLQNVDDTAYSSLPADTGHSILKQGLLVDAVTLPLQAPSTSGFSQNYLIQVAHEESDTESTVLPYYNASNPTQAWHGPNNSGTAQGTVRSGKCVVKVKAGIAATTGTQNTPGPDSGCIGAFVVTVAAGQTEVTSANIMMISNAPFLPAGGLVAGIQTGQMTYARDYGAQNAYAADFAPPVTSLIDGMRLTFLASNTNTDASTFSPNGLAAAPVYSNTNTALTGGEILASAQIEVIWNSTLSAWVLANTNLSALSKGFVKSVNSHDPDEHGNVNVTAADVNALPLIPTPLTVDLNTLGAPSSAGVYNQPLDAKATTANHYPINQAGSLMVTPSAHGCQQEYTSYALGRKFTRGLSGEWNGKDGPWFDWKEILNTGTADTRYLKKAGDTATGRLTIVNNSNALTLQRAVERQSCYALGKDFDGANLWYVGLGSAGYEVNYYNYKGLNGVTLAEDGTVSVTCGNNQPLLTNTYFRTNAPTGAGAWANQNNVAAPFHNEFTDDSPSVYHPLFKQKHNLADKTSITWSGGILVSEDSFHIHAINTTGSLTTFTFTKDGQFIPGAYGNFDQRYLGKSGGVTATRQSADVALATAASAVTVTPAGAWMSGLQLTGDGSTGTHVASMRHRTEQYAINGTWYNAAKASVTAPVTTVKTPKTNAKISKLTRLSAYTPETGAETFEHEGKQLTAEHLVSAEGYDWYGIQSLITGNHFITYDDNGVIVQISQDASHLTPAGFSVAGLLEIPDGCDIDGTWTFNGEAVSQDADIVAARILAVNEDMRLKYANQAMLAVTTIQAGLVCGRSREGDSDALTAWQGYLCDLRDMTPEQLQQEDVEFPTAPAAAF